MDLSASPPPAVVALTASPVARRVAEALGAPLHARAGRAEGVVTDRVIGIGGRRLLTVRHGGETVRIKCAAAEAPPPGAPLRFSVPPDRVVLFDPEGRALEHGAPS